MSAWTVISQVEVGSGGQAEIEFASISSSFTDLCILISARSTQTNSNDNLFIRLNTSSSNFTARIIEGTGAAVNNDASARYLGAIPGSTATASTFGSILVYIPNYSGSRNKSFNVDSVQENNQTTAYAHLISQFWTVTDAITNIVLDPSGGNFAQYSSATLYGITKGSSNGVTVS
jgi:hypothetical protein